MTPVFLGYNFAGNYLLHNDPFILIDGKKENELSGDSFEKFKTQKRGERSSRWAIEKIIESGYGLVTLNYNDVDPDKINKIKQWKITVPILNSEVDCSSTNNVDENTLHDA